MKKLLRIISKALLILLGLAVAWVAFVSLVLQDNTKPYEGGYAPDGAYCEFGYKYSTKTCCDEDDYSCEFCDLHGIYCDLDSMFQRGFSDIDHIPNMEGEGDYNCTDFIDWHTAQKVYIRDNGIKKDPYNLDEDRDGLACEALLKEWGNNVWVDELIEKHSKKRL